MNVDVSRVLERAWGNLAQVWRRISQAARTDFGKPGADLPDGDVRALRRQIGECLISKGGEVSSRARAAAIGQIYLTLNDRGKKRFLEILATDFGVDHGTLLTTIASVPEARTPEQRGEVHRTLREVLTPRHLKLLTQFNSLPSGVKFLVDLRADVMRYGRTDPALRGLDQDLKGLLASWFDVGFLDLEQITWNSPASLLERLIAYEAVHEIESWDALKRRLGEDRRCFAFFHPRMPEEPLIFVEVALVPGMSDNIQTLLDESRAHPDPETANTAIFYSISNTQAGLHGVSLGNFLIKRVVDRLTAELPNLGTFATLSPIPDFGSYLRGHPGEEVPVELLRTPHWHRNPGTARALEGPLTRLCARYLLTESRTNLRALDRVAHFHLSNGARIERINWLADTSAKGLDQSAGMMVNYRYEPGQIEENHERYRETGAAAASPEVLGLLEAAVGSDQPDR